MVTDRVPSDKILRSEFIESDRLKTFELPADDRLPTRASRIEAAMQSESAREVRLACAEFLSAAAEFYRVSNPSVKVLAARPLRVREDGWGTELFGDYHPETLLIRVWMRTAIRKHVTSYGTFLSTLCHEFCHHLDFAEFGFHDSPHTRGFYERTAILYHHARGTPLKPLEWIPLPADRWRIDWARTNRVR